MMDSLIAGVDIGGSHITAALVDLDKKIILETSWRRMAVNSQGSAQDIISCWSRVIGDCFRAGGMEPSKIGIAMPGPFDYREGIALMKDQNKYDALYGLNVKELLAGRLHLAPEDISLANDAACFLQGEVFCGVATKADPVLGLTLGTGLGSARATAGLAEDANLWCSPFKEGMAEEYLSTRWFVQRYEALTGHRVRDVKELVDRKEADPAVGKIFCEFGKSLGEFLSPLVAAENSQLVVVGGSIAQSFPLFAPALQSVLEEAGLKVNVKRSVLGENAALLGAVSYCLKDQVRLNSVA